MRKKRSEQGSILMEAIICLPVLLLISLGVGQFAHIWYCRQIVHYAAYSGARATLTASANTEQAQATNAARRICSLVSFTGTSGTDLNLPGVGVIGGSGTVNNKMQVRIMTPTAWHRGCEVQMDVPLLFPFAGQIIGQAVSLWTNGDFDVTVPNTTSGVITNPEPTGVLSFPHIRLRERAYMVKPYVSTWTTD